MDYVAFYLNKIKNYDVKTYEHCKRVAKISLLIGKNLGLNKKELKLLHSSAILHDLGKVAIPIDILNKKEQLNEAEFNLIKKHPQLSLDIIENSEHLPVEVIEGIISHHEFFNGHGYNKGLKGESIPLESRVIAIADAFDAMITFRPYKSTTLTIREASNEILDCAGEQFDPYVVRKIFLRMTEEKYKEKVNIRKITYIEGGDDI